MVAGEGGVFSYTGIKDIQELEKNIEAGDEKANLVLSAMVYQTAKEIGGLAAALDGDVNGIVLTGGIAHSRRITDMITKKVSFLAKVFLMPGEFEIEALADSAKRALENPEILKEYS
jgi:butyrate kinase